MMQTYCMVILLLFLYWLFPFQVFSQCYEGGAVSPATCIYMKEWMEYWHRYQESNEGCTQHESDRVLWYTMMHSWNRPPVSIWKTGWSTDIGTMKLWRAVHSENLALLWYPHTMTHVHVQYYTAGTLVPWRMYNGNSYQPPVSMWKTGVLTIIGTTGGKMIHSKLLHLCMCTHTDERLGGVLTIIGTRKLGHYNTFMKLVCVIVYSCAGIYKCRCICGVIKQNQSEVGNIDFEI